MSFMRAVFHQPGPSRGARWLSILLPQDCQLCAAASGAALLCCGCLESLPRTGAACCPQCAMPSPAGEPCGTCLKRPPHFDATHAALRYAFPADRLVQSLKYNARLPVAVLLADLLLEHQRKTGATLPDAFIPMPLHPARLATRGYNQAVEIARHVARTLQRPLLTATAVRLRNTPPQADLPLERRHANLRGAFACHDDQGDNGDNGGNGGNGNNRHIAGLSVAVVDDVMTTGASLNELARVLKRAGAARVENWVAARTWLGEKHV